MAGPSGVVPVQYTEPIESALNQQAPAQNRESFASSVPREPMMEGMMAPPGYGYVTSPPPMGGGCQSCGAGRSYASHSFQNHAGCGYQPVFQQFSQSCGPVDFVAPIPREQDPQEFIFDGGDREPRVRVRKDNTQSGLEPEDTVVQFETIDGRVHTESGCRVAIYAPRFGSVRKRTAFDQKDSLLQVVDMSKPDGPRISRSQLPPRVETNRVRPLLDNNVKIVESTRHGTRPIPTESILTPIVVVDQQELIDMISLLQSSTLKITNRAMLETAINAARTWSSVDDIDVLVNGQEPMSVIATKEQQGVTHYERKGSRIRLCKVASEQMAQPGDKITFTISVDNVGEQPLSSIVVTDSLAPRLEYIPDSERSTLKSEFSLTPNSAGSEILRWELREELKPGYGTLISFDCLVR
jgi:uncharacterized repeat protein (TIGR01451 family)